MMEKAKSLVSADACSVAAITADGQVHCDTGASVRPLFRLYQQLGGAMKGAVVADRVIGKAAASILCCAGVAQAFSFVMSETGRDMLLRHTILADWDRLVPSIVNRRGDDLCPMEKMLLDTDDPEECVRRIAAFVARQPDAPF